MVIALMLVRCIKKGPEEIVAKAGLDLSKAERYRAGKFSSEQYHKAKMYFDSAMSMWNVENEKLVFNRDYKRVEDYAEKSLHYSKQAIRLALENDVKLENEITFRISKIKQQILDLDIQFGHLPFNEDNTTNLAKIKLQLSESIFLYKQSKYFLASEKLDTLEYNLSRIEENQKNLLTDYFRSYPQWKRMVNNTISNSRKNSSYCIIIDKYNRKCLVYYRGLLIENFSVELGSNWIGDKNVQGDKSTPEGEYKIVAKKKNGETKYYKALLIDYPNEEDQKRFLLNKKNGILKTHDKIGSLIEIHGEGGRGTDWTDGCIALTNKDMDRLFEVSQIGTPVIIVGSVKSLEEINNNSK